MPTAGYGADEERPGQARAPNPWAGLTAIAFIILCRCLRLR